MTKPLSLVKPSRSTLSKLWYLFHLSSKYDFNLTSLYKNLIEAYKCQPQTCGPLTIECRGDTEGFLVFLLTDESEKSVRQLRFPQIMLEKDVMLKLLERQEILRYKGRNYPEFLNLMVKPR